MLAVLSIDRGSSFETNGPSSLIVPRLNDVLKTVSRGDSNFIGCAGLQGDIIQAGQDWLPPWHPEMRVRMYTHPSVAAWAVGLHDVRRPNT